MKTTIAHALQTKRQTYQPIVPRILQNLAQIALSTVEEHLERHDHQKIKALFPLSCEQPVLIGKIGSASHISVLKVGVVLSGGQAAGGHNVITGIFDALKEIHPDSQLFGFLNGPGGIVSGKSKELTHEFLEAYRNQGGFDMIGSGRTKIETEEQLSATLAVVSGMQLDGLVIIGGDDSNTNAAILAEYFLKYRSKTKVIGVPKTIDGDLQNSHVAISFGFDTACKIYSEIIGNIARDAASAQKYYHFIKLMGRSASHIALECALQTQPNLTLIGEEVSSQNKTLAELTKDIADVICERAKLGKNHGVILIPEGLIEFIPEIGILIKELNQLLGANPNLSLSEIKGKLSSASQACLISLPERIQQQLLLNRDPHGNVQVSLIETERLMIETVTKELQERRSQGAYTGKFSAQHHFLGYEGRAGFPSNFDCNYCYSLGMTAALLIDKGATGYMAFVSSLTQSPQDWGIGGVPLTALMNIEMRKGKEKPVIQKALIKQEDQPFAYFQQHRESWKYHDHYLYPGPIQFYGDAHLTEQIPLTLTLKK